MRRSWRGEQVLGPPLQTGPWGPAWDPQPPLPHCSHKPLTAKPQMAPALQKLSPCSQPAPLSGKTPGPLSAWSTRVLRQWVFPRSWGSESNRARPLCQECTPVTRHLSMLDTALCWVFSQPCSHHEKNEAGARTSPGKAEWNLLFKPAMPFLYRSLPFIPANQQFLQFQWHQLKALTMGITADRI